MIKFNKPNQLNGSQLCEELIKAGVKIDNPLNTCSIDEYGDFWLNIADKDEAKAKPVVEAHVGVDQTQAKAQAKAAAESKLAALGLTTDDLRALGL
jgi:hypothetical protein